MSNLQQLVEKAIANIGQPVIGDGYHITWLGDKWAYFEFSGEDIYYADNAVIIRTATSSRKINLFYMAHLPGTQEFLVDVDDLDNLKVITEDMVVTWTQFQANV